MDKTKATLILSLIVFILLLLFLFAPLPDSLRRNLFPFAGILALVFLILGIILIVIGFKRTSMQSFFLLLTGFSAASPLVYSILHNVFYGINMIFPHPVFEYLHVSSFLISVIGAPILYIIGLIGSFITLRKN